MANSDYSEFIGQAKDHIWMSHAQYSGREDTTSLGIAMKGEGCYIIDHEGNRYLDATGGSHCCLIGHGRKEIADAVYDQMMALEFTGSGLVPFTNIPYGQALEEDSRTGAGGPLPRLLHSCPGRKALRLPSRWSGSTTPRTASQRSSKCFTETTPTTATRGGL